MESTAQAVFETVDQSLLANIVQERALVLASRMEYPAQVAVATKGNLTIHLAQIGQETVLVLAKYTECPNQVVVETGLVGHNPIC
jgi:hypothetical protein